MSGIDDMGRLVDTIAAHFANSARNKQAVLESAPVRREQLPVRSSKHEVDILRWTSRIRGRVKRQMEKSQREYPPERAGQGQKSEGARRGEEGADIDETVEEDQGRSRHAQGRRAKKADARIQEALAMSPMSAEATVVRNYIETLVALPWKRRAAPTRIWRRPKVLNEDHYGLGQGQGAHRRIPGGSAAGRQGQGGRGSGAVMVGPPRRQRRRWVSPSPGRWAASSSASPSAACATRPRSRAPPTYVGALPGIVRAIGEAGTMNPVVLLDGSTRSVPTTAATRARAARGARPGAEPHVPRPLPRTGPGPLRRGVPGDRQRRGEHPVGAAGPDGTDHPRRLHRDDKVAIARDLLPRQARTRRPDRRRSGPSPKPRCARSPPTTPGTGRAAVRAAAGQRRCARPPRSWTPPESPGHHH